MVVCDVEVIRKERVCKKEQMQNREDAKQGLVGGPVPYTCQFLLVVTAAAVCGDSWTRSSGRAGGGAAAAWIAPGCIVEAFPIAIAEAFPVCLASGACTDIMAAATAVVSSTTRATTAASAVTAASTATATVIAAAASAVTAAARASTVAAASTTTVVTATATSTITTIPSTSTKSKATHILYSPFLLVCTISYGTPRQSVSDCLNVFYCHPLFFFS